MKLPDDILTQPKVLTVIIQTRDRPEFLQTALRSVRHQIALDRVASVLVSDNGMASSEHVMGEFADLPIEYVRTDSKLSGTEHMREATLRSRTPLVAFLHDDDWWHPSHLALGLRELAEHPECSYYAGSSLWVSGEDHRGSILGARHEFLSVMVAASPDAQVLSLSPKQVQMAAWIATPFHLSTFIGRTDPVKECMEDIVNEEFAFAIDDLFYARLARASDSSWRYQMNYVAYVRAHQGSLTATIQNEYKLESFRRTREHLRAFAEQQKINLNAEWRAVLAGADPQVRARLKGISLEWMSDEFHTRQDWLEMGLEQVDPQDAWPDDHRKKLDSLQATVAELVETKNCLTQQYWGWRDQAERKTRAIREMAPENVKIRKENSLLRRQVDSAKAWQSGSWFKRAFHKWRAPKK